MSVFRVIWPYVNSHPYSGLHGGRWIWERQRVPFAFLGLLLTTISENEVYRPTLSPHSLHTLSIPDPPPLLTITSFNGTARAARAF